MDMFDFDDKNTNDDESLVDGFIEGFKKAADREQGRAEERKKQHEDEDKKIAEKTSSL
jgi:hypothetical protein